ncbi:HAD family hydrolase [Phyllobacterium phragmitis]|uniref:HAD family phosphatase n=1 Tax=Phyllobacterium phragmitis TaxID=2670329 RepID=A0ABQ0H5M2_9HYPH
MYRKVKAVIFDLDGVLVDAADWHYESLNLALGHFGLAIPFEDHKVRFDGLPTRVKLKMLSESKGLPVSLHDFINALKQRYTMEMFHTKCQPYFPHEYLLASLKKHDLRISVASNSIRQTVDVALKRSALDKYVDFFLSNEDVGKAKPDPEIYLASFERHGLRPDECIIVEDNEKGIKAARAAGGHVLVVDSVEDVNYLNVFNLIEKIETTAL